MFQPKDMTKMSDRAMPVKGADTAKTVKDKVEKLTRELERSGVDRDNASQIAQKTVETAEAPIALDDWCKLDASRFSPETREQLQQSGLTSGVVMADKQKAEQYVGQVIAHEGLPDGNGGVEKLKAVVPGHYDTGGHGIDQVGVKQDGSPFPIEAKTYKHTSQAELRDVPIGGRAWVQKDDTELKLEPAVASWRAEREKQAQSWMNEQAKLGNISSKEDWRPEARTWRHDAERIEYNDGKLPVQQMDDLWVQDRWLKVIKDDEGRARMEQAGVGAKYRDYSHMSSAPDLPEWKAMLSEKTTVVVSDDHGSLGRHLFDQAAFERPQNVYKIELEPPAPKEPTEATSQSPNFRNSVSG